MVAPLCCTSSAAWHIGWVAVLLFAQVSGAAAEETRALVPDETRQREALKLLGEVHGEEYRKAATPAEKAAWAKKMLGLAGEAKQDPTARFVLLKVARDIAIEAGDAETALGAAHATAESFRVDGFKLRTNTLLEVAKSAASPNDNRLLATRAPALVAQAVARDEYDLASQLGRVALAAARKARDQALARQLIVLGKEVERVAKAHEKVQDALATLERKPADPDANQAAGEYFCFSKGDWNKGVAMLALGSDPVLKELGRKELEGAGSPEEQAKMGDGWWDAAAERRGLQRDAMMRRAGFWYEQARPKVTAVLLSAKLSKRLEEIAKLGPPGVAQAAPSGGPVLGVDPKHEIGNVTHVEQLLQLWMILPELSKPGVYRLSIKHGAAGAQGAFYLTAWTDRDGDGLPDTEIAHSKKMTASKAGQWSSWEFTSKVERIYVGNFWEQRGTLIYYTTERPQGYQGLGKTLYCSKSFRQLPHVRATPRFTNIRVQRIR
jgi:hypothetical protein